VAGDLAFVVENAQGLEIADVSIPESPRIVGALDLPGYAKGVDTSDELVFVAAAESGLVVVDAALPEYPRIIGAIDTPGDARSVLVRGDLAYLPDGAPACRSSTFPIRGPHSSWPLWRRREKRRR